MRFVRGRTLLEASHDYHKARAAGTATALDLVALLNAFVGVCNALAYAHSRGVIHRDLKGQNVVLGDFGEVIVLDWGLAKLRATAPTRWATTWRRSPTTAAPGTRRSPGRALGTPAYMPPEQAAGRLDEIDVRSDVYGLGAILFEILTGRVPVRGVDHGRPSSGGSSRRSRPGPAPSSSSVPPALEAICLKAMAKRQSDRYESAAALADDVRRWIADEPVAAYPDPWPVRLGRWAKRHRTAVAAAAALLVTGVVALSVGSVLVRRERNEALAQRNEARAQRRVARTAVDEMYTGVAEKWLEDHLDAIQREFLEKALAHYEAFAEHDADDPSIRLERGRGPIIGWATSSTSSAATPRRRRPTVARSNYSATWRPRLRPTPSRGTTWAPAGRAWASSSPIGATTPRPRPSSAMPWRRSSPSARPSPPRLRPASTWPGPTRGWPTLLRVQSKHRRRRGVLRRRAAEILKQIPEGRDDFAPRQLLASARDRLGLLYKDTGRFAEAATTYARGLEVVEGLVNRYPTLPKLREALVNGLRSVGLLEQTQGNDDQAARRPAQSVAGGRRAARSAISRSAPSIAATWPGATSTSAPFWTRRDSGQGRAPLPRPPVPLYEAATIAEVPGACSSTATTSPGPATTSAWSSSRSARPTRPRRSPSAPSPSTRTSWPAPRAPPSIVPTSPGAR